MEEKPTTTTTTAPGTTYTTIVPETFDLSTTNMFVEFDNEVENGGTQHEELGKIAKLKKLGKFVLAKLGDEKDFVAPKIPPIPETHSLNALTSTETWAPEATPEEDEGFVDLNKVKIPHYEQSLSTDEVVAGFLERSVVKGAPPLDSIASDTTRTNTITRIVTNRFTGGRSAEKGEQVITETEQAAAADFKGYLESFIKVAKKVSSQTENVERAKDMLENLTFIGEKERQEAIKGLAAYWKHYLREDENNQLCAVAGVRRSGNGHVKSGEFLLDGLLGEFSEEELEEFKGRLMTDLEDITADPDHTKIILLDDWVISGSQMDATIGGIAHSSSFSSYYNSIEINLITCNRQRIEGGFYRGYAANIPIKSYFLSHAARSQTSYSAHNTYETGAHSSVDYDFESEYIDKFAQSIRQLKTDETKGSENLSPKMPGLTAIVRPYRNNPLVNIKRLEEQVKSTRNSRELQGVV